MRNKSKYPQSITLATRSSPLTSATTWSFIRHPTMAEASQPSFFQDDLSSNTPGSSFAADLATGWVYLISRTDTQLYKIGVTGNWPQRAKQLRVGDGYVALVHLAKTALPMKHEKDLHKRFQDKRLPQSEWFLLNEPDILFIKSYLIRAEGNLRALLASVELPAVLSMDNQALRPPSEGHEQKEQGKQDSNGPNPDSQEDRITICCPCCSHQHSVEAAESTDWNCISCGASFRVESPQDVFGLSPNGTLYRWE